MIQKKPNQTTLRMADGGLSTETPSMHPGGRLASDVSLDEHDRMNISAISASHLDHPPDYEDALINSKPISWFKRHQSQHYDNVDAQHNQESSSYHYLPISTASHESQRATAHGEHFSEQQSKSLAQQQSTQSASSATTHTSTIITSSNNMAQFALSIVRGFASIEPSSIHQQVVNRTRRISQDQNTSTHQSATRQRSRANGNNIRKPSYCQLDVNQLILSTSPPKYTDLTFNDHCNVSLHNYNETRGSE